jgi:autotransporter-associated beta strand protein
MRREYYLFRVGILLAVAIGLMATPARALVEHPNTIAYPNSEELPLMSDRPADAVVGWWSYNASAVAIAPNYIITTCHQGGGVGTTVSFGGTAYRVAEVFQHGKADLRIARITTLDGAADANLTSFVSCNIDRTEISILNPKTAVIGGFGYGRGTTYSTYYTWAQTDNKTERWGQNKLESSATYGSLTDPSVFTTDVLKASFDNYGVGNWVEYEASIAKFDSGGGWFLKDPGTGQWQVAGLSRGVTDHGGAAYFSPADTLDCVRVSSYATWLNNAFNQSKWNSSSGGNWSTAGNWSGAVPNVKDKWAVFGDTVSADRTVTLDTSPTVGTLRFDCPGNLTISAGGSNKLTFNVNSTVDAAQIETGNTNGSGALTITAPITMSASLVVRHNSAGTLTISGPITGSKSLTKAGTGTLLLTNANTYSGGTAILQGTLRVTNAAALGTTTGGAYVTLAGATLDVQSDSALTLSNKVKVIPNSALGVSASTLNVDRATAGPARTMTFGGSLTTDGAMTLNVTSATGCSAAFSGLASIMNLGAGGVATINTASADLALTGGLAIQGGTLTKSGPKMLTLSGTQTHNSGSTLKVNEGTLALNADAGSASAYNLGLVTSGGAAVMFGSTQHLAGLTLGGSSTATLAEGSNKVVITKSINIAGGSIPTGKLDITDGRLVINYEGDNPMPMIRDQIIAAFNKFLWDGNGIGSDKMTADPFGSYSIGYADNSQLLVPYGPATEFTPANPFGDTTDVAPNAILVRYTLIGDVDLNGVVDDTDISLLTNSYLFTGMNWSTGDVYGYDGKVDDADVSVQANNYMLTAGNLLAEIGDPLASGQVVLDTAYDGASASAPVPEPMTVLLLGAGSMALAVRRRRLR